MTKKERHSVITVSDMVYSNSEKLEIAKVMLQQLGGNAFVYLRGAKVERIYERDGMVVLRLKVGKNAKGINRFEMAYNEGQDLYELRFIRNRKNTDVVTNEYKEVYCDMLSRLFEEATELYVMPVRMVVNY